MWIFSKYIARFSRYFPPICDNFVFVRPKRQEKFSDSTISLLFIIIDLFVVNMLIVLFSSDLMFLIEIEIVSFVSFVSVPPSRLFLLRSLSLASENTQGAVKVFPVSVIIFNWKVDHGATNANNIKGIRSRGNHKSVIRNIATIKANGIRHYGNLQFLLLPLHVHWALYTVHPLKLSDIHD